MPPLAIGRALSGSIPGIFAVARSAKNRRRRAPDSTVAERGVADRGLALDTLQKGPADCGFHGVDDHVGNLPAGHIDGDPGPLGAEPRVRVRVLGDDDIAGATGAALFVQAAFGVAQGGGFEIAVAHGVDESHLQRLRRTHRRAREKHPERIAHAHDARETLGAARARDDAEVDLGKAEPRTAVRNPVVTGQRGLEAAAERGAVHRRDHRLLQSFDQRKHRMTVRLAQRRVELGNVGACDEGASLAQEQDCLDG